MVAPGVVGPGVVASSDEGAVVGEHGAVPLLGEVVVLAPPVIVVITSDNGVVGAAPVPPSLEVLPPVVVVVSSEVSLGVVSSVPHVVVPASNKGAIV